MSATHHQLRPIITSRPIHSLPEAPYCLSPCSEVPELDASDYFTSDKLCFPKFPIAPSSSSVFAATSTDSDAPSTSHENDGYCSPASRLPRSPSLLSSLFQSQPASAVSSAAPSRHNSTTGTCSTRASTGLATPLSPISATPLPFDALACTAGEQGQEGSRRKIAFACAPTTRDCKPILRKLDAASTSTSASEDNGGYRSARGLKLVGTGDKKCALTFAVKPYYPPGTFARSTSQSSTIPRDDQAGPSRPSRSRSPSYIADCEWDDIRTPEAEELEESDDEGYEEDEEGGFTDDEDELGTFAAQGSRSNRFTWSRRPSFIPSSHHTLTATPRRRVPVETYCTTDDNYPEPIRGRKISIAARTTDKCSRHLSPPPRSPSPDSAPPAARSPSARDLCMRRDKAKGPRDPSEAAQGWKSDSAFMEMGSRAERMGIGAEGLVQARKASLPGQAECKSILRCSVPPPSPSVVQSVQRRTASPRSTIDLSPLPSPKYSFHRPPLSPSSASLCTVNSNCATSVSEACGDARSGLQLALGGAA